MVMNIGMDTLEFTFRVGLVNTIPDVLALLARMSVYADPLRYEMFLDMRLDGRGRTWPVTIGFAEPHLYFPESGVPQTLVAAGVTDTGVPEDIEDTRADPGASSSSEPAASVADLDAMYWRVSPPSCRLQAIITPDHTAAHPLKAERITR